MSKQYYVDYFGDEKFFKTKKKAIAYAQKHYLADKKGRITLISESLHDEYEDEETGEHIYVRYAKKDQGDNTSVNQSGWDPVGPGQPQGYTEIVHPMCAYFVHRVSSIGFVPIR